MDSMPDPTKAPWPQRNIWPLVVGALFFVGLVLFFGWVAIVRYNEFVEHFDPATAPIHLRPDTLGPFGDFFGGIANPLLSFVGVCALFYTIYLQKDELRLTQDELVESKKAFKAQEEELKRQNAQMRTQIKRDDFFRLINFMLKGISEVTIPDTTPLSTLTGREATSRLREKIISNKLNELYPTMRRPISLEEIKQKTIQIIHLHKECFEKFIKSTIIVINFALRESDSADYEFYINMINSSLTNDEIMLLSMYAISKDNKTILQYISQSSFRINDFPLNENENEVMKCIITEAKLLINRKMAAYASTQDEGRNG